MSAPVRSAVLGICVASGLAAADTPPEPPAATLSSVPGEAGAAAAIVGVFWPDDGRHGRAERLDRKARVIGPRLPLVAAGTTRAEAERWLGPPADPITRYFERQPGERFGGRRRYFVVYYAYLIFGRAEQRGHGLKVVRVYYDQTGREPGAGDMFVLYDGPHSPGDPVDPRVGRPYPSPGAAGCAEAIQRRDGQPGRSGLKPRVVGPRLPMLTAGLTRAVVEERIGPPDLAAGAWAARPAGAGDRWAAEGYYAHLLPGPFQRYAEGVHVVAVWFDRAAARPGPGDKLVTITGPHFPE